MGTKRLASDDDDVTGEAKRHAAELLVPEARARNQAAARLAARNANPADLRVSFTEETHEYHVDGKKAPISATTVVKNSFDPHDHFDADKVVEKWFDKWMREGAKSEYFSVTKRVKNGEITVDEGKELIKETWRSAGPLGTKMHAVIELHLDRFAEGGEWTVRSCINAETAELAEGVEPELKQFDEWASSKWVRDRGLVPWRTELSVFYEVDGVCVCAGQIDALFRDKDGNFYILDWKRVKPKYALTAIEPCYGKFAHAFPKIACNKFNEYSFQLSLYVVMMEHSHGWKVDEGGGRLFLLRMHKDLGTYQLVPCRDFREQARAVLDRLPTEEVEEKEPIVNVTTRKKKNNKE